MRKREDEQVDLECLAGYLGEVKNASSSEALLSAAETFAARMEEVLPRLSAEALTRLCAELKTIVAEAARSKNALAERIRETADRLEKLRGIGKCGVGGLGSGSGSGGSLV